MSAKGKQKKPVVSSPKGKGNRSSSQRKPDQSKIEKAVRVISAELSTLESKDRGIAIARICGIFNVHPKSKTKSATKKPSSSSKKSKPEPEKKNEFNATFSLTTCGRLLFKTSSILKAQTATQKVSDSTYLVHRVLLHGRAKAKKFHELATLADPNSADRTKYDKLTDYYGIDNSDSLDTNDFILRMSHAVSGIVKQGAFDMNASLAASPTPELLDQLFELVRCVRRGSRFKGFPKELWNQTTGQQVPCDSHYENRDPSETTAFQDLVDARKARKTEARKRRRSKERTEGSGVKRSRPGDDSGTASSEEDGTGSIPSGSDFEDETMESTSHFD